MKRFLVLLICLFLSTPCFGKWTKVTEGTLGDVVYLDFETIRKVDGYHYFWTLNDYKKPLLGIVYSTKVYYQSDCKLFRYKFLNQINYYGQMGKGEFNSDIVPDKVWSYPPPKSLSMRLLKIVCER